MASSDETRLRNLLRNYRDHIITIRANKFKHIPPHKIVDEVDEAILIIKSGLSKKKLKKMI